MMYRTYNVFADRFFPTKDSDIQVWAVLLGERGRGRELTPVVVDDRIVGENGTIAEYVSLGATRSGKPKLIPASHGNTASAWLARIYTNSGYLRNARGWVGVLPGSTVTVIAKGYGAFGDAGRIGRWQDILAIVPSNTWVRVKCTRSDPYYLWFGDVQGSANPQKVREDAIDAFCDGMDIPVPPLDADAWDNMWTINESNC